MHAVLRFCALTADQLLFFLKPWTYWADIPTIAINNVLNRVYKIQFVLQNIENVFDVKWKYSNR